MENSKLKFEVGELRKNIEYLSKKLENFYQDNEKLLKNNNNGAMEKGQLSHELHQLQMAFRKLEEEKEYQNNKFLGEIKMLRK